MENYIKQHDEAKQVSMTGARALVILLSLFESPKTFEEIRDLLVECGVVDKEYSIDTIRIDINTLKAIGCKITKATKRNNHKYGLLYHPMNLVLTPEEVKTLKKIYKKISKVASPNKILKYHKLFQKMSDMVEDDNIKNQLLGISILKGENINLIEELVKDEKKNNKIRIAYKPVGHPEEEYEISIEKLELRSNKLYVFCYNHTLSKRMFLNVSRIKSIICKMFDKGSSFGLDTTVKFKLNYFNDYEIEENETILESKNNCAIIEGKYFNEFIAIQRMLSFGSDCVVIEPEEIKETVINKLKEMRSMYV